MQKITVTLDDSAQNIMNWLKQQMKEDNDSLVVEEALHSLYREFHLKHQHPRSFEYREPVNPEEDVR